LRGRAARLSRVGSSRAFRVTANGSRPHRADTVALSWPGCVRRDIGLASTCLRCRSPPERSSPTIGLCPIPARRRAPRSRSPRRCASSW
jgi:hypothetical protein